MLFDCGQLEASHLSESLGPGRIAGQGSLDIRLLVLGDLALVVLDGVGEVHGHGRLPANTEDHDRGQRAE